MSTTLPGGLRILVSGAYNVHRNNSDEKAKRVLEFCHALGVALAASAGEVPLILITGGRGKSFSADRAVIEGAQKVLKPAEFSKRIITFPPLDLKQSLDKIFNKTMIVKPRGVTRQSRRFQMVKSADIVISIAGSVGAPEAIHLAQALEIPALPLLFTGAGSSGESMEEATKDFGLPKKDLSRWVQAAKEPDADLVPYAERVAQLVREKATLPCFAAMPYGDPDIEELYQTAIVPAMRDAAFRPIRSDEQRRPGIILSQMLGAIQSSAAMVAILTDGRYLNPEGTGIPKQASPGVNPNVMYEVGYASALKIPTILIAKQPGTLPFDLSVDRTIDMEQEDLMVLREMVTSALRTIRVPEE